MPAEGLRLTPDEAGRRLAALGFADPDGALRHIESLTAGLSRRATLQRALLPVLLSDFADAPDPDGGLLAYRQVSDELGATPWYLRLLRDEGAVAIAAGLPARHQPLRRAHARPRARGAAHARRRRRAGAARPRRDRARRCARRPRGRTTRPPRSRAVRGVRRQELLRIAFADLLGTLDVVQVCAGDQRDHRGDRWRPRLQVAARAVAADAGHRAAAASVRGHRDGPPRRRRGRVRLGRRRDVRLRPGVPATLATPTSTRHAAQEVAGRLRALLSAPSSTDPPLGIDADLRPEGRNGPLVRSLASYGSTTRAGPRRGRRRRCCGRGSRAGDAELGARFIALIDPVRYPAAG